MNGAVFSSDGKWVVTKSADDTVRIWNVERGKETAVLKGHTDAVSNAAFSRDGKRVVTASLDNTARIWDAESGKEIAILNHDPDLMEALRRSVGVLSRQRPPSLRKSPGRRQAARRKC